MESEQTKDQQQGQDEEQKESTTHSKNAPPEMSKDAPNRRQNKNPVDQSHETLMSPEPKDLAEIAPELREKLKLVSPDLKKPAASRSSGHGSVSSGEDDNHRTQAGGQGWDNGEDYDDSGAHTHGTTFRASRDDDPGEKTMQLTGKTAQGITAAASAAREETGAKCAGKGDGTKAMSLESGARAKKGKKKALRFGRQPQPKFTSWDVGRLGEHSMDHLPTYIERVPQIKEYIDQNILKKPEIFRQPLSSDVCSSDCAVKEYLEKHGICQLFRMLVTLLLYHKPERPLDCLIDTIREMARQYEAATCTPAGVKGRL
ncbi:uncharacterized protein LOC101854861 [Aplysia californica]|uniref:Uncharacterized protein LOC101854861 n=1 Tax=Aplysia californica TaxID=6500 RepID=A0ABM0ZYM8_APLCA|nr:uncharacterized protein LOC101854861 [Aplysia californica]